MEATDYSALIWPFEWVCRRARVCCETWWRSNISLECVNRGRVTFNRIGGVVDTRSPFYNPCHCPVPTHTYTSVHKEYQHERIVYIPCFRVCSLLLYSLQFYITFAYVCTSNRLTVDSLSFYSLLFCVVAVALTLSLDDNDSGILLMNWHDFIVCRLAIILIQIK